MDPAGDNHSHRDSASSDSLSFHGYNCSVATTRSPDPGELAFPSTNEQAGSIELDFERAVRLLDSLALGRRQINQRRKYEYRTAPSCLAPIDEHDIDEAYAAVFSERLRGMPSNQTFFLLSLEHDQVLRDVIPQDMDAVVLSVQQLRVQDEQPTIRDQI
jgi:hypothetical protein